MPEETSRCIDGLKRDTTAVGKTGADSPASLLPKRGRARGTDNLLALDDCTDESVIDGRVCSVVLWVLARKETIFEICHDPRSFTRTGSPDSVVAKVNGFHVAIACIFAADFGIAIIEAATSVVVCTIEDGVHTLWLITCSGTADMVVTVPSSRRDENAIRFLPVEGHRCTISTRQVIITIGLWSVEATRGCLGQVIAATRLVINDGDETSGTAAEGVLCRGIRDATLC
ncbi:hypothetical protein HG531_000969 [Fusarium graminearum]|nr:hypothetical protein HG531_000969 [Fusarium graminearum]